VRDRSQSAHLSSIRAIRTTALLSLFVLPSLAVRMGAQQQPPASSEIRTSPAEIDPGQEELTPTLPRETTTTLTAMQIGMYLRERPELVVELKQLAAEQLQQQGLKVQADAITDEVLYNQIASNQPLRTAITTFLHARGYITTPDPEIPERQDADALDELAPTRSSRLSQLPDSTLPGDDSLAALGQQNPDFPRLPRSSAPSPQPHVIDPTSSPGRLPTTKPSQRETEEHNTTDSPQVLRRPAPYNLQSLRDLYTQIPEDSGKLKRFGSEVFLSRTTISTPLPLSDSPVNASQNREAPLDIPIGPDYVIGPGDSLVIDLWGGVSQTINRTIDREGRISLPESGSLSLAGLTLERAEAVIQDLLRKQFRDAHAAVTVSRLRTVRVYVVGDVQRPGAYDINSLSTPLNALFAAGGPTGVGSLRTLRHYRGKKLVAEIDLYDFLLNGNRSSDDRFQGGDTLLVPPTGPQVAVSGAVKRPAIYELKSESTLAEVLANAGGATVAAALSHITIERIDANQHRETVTIALPDSSSAAPDNKPIAAFPIKDGDRIHIAPILPFSERAVYMEGHVSRPGRIAYRDGMRLNDVLHSYQDLLPEPAAQGEIIRLIAPDLHAETIEFNVADALIGNSPLTLQPFDTIRVLGRYQVDSPRVTIRGEVLRPGGFPLSEGMTAAQLVRMAGGFKRDALQQEADLTSYHIIDGSKVVGQRSTIRIGDAVGRNDATADALLKPGDILTVHQITGWSDIGASVTIEGEASHPGSYGFQQGERLSSVLRRAGGLRDTAYPAGAVLLREQVRRLEETSRTELIRQIETSSAAARLGPNLTSGDSSGTLQIIQQQQEQVLARLRSQPASGRLVIHITSDIDSWANTDADIEVRRGDILNIPKRPGFVLISGQVYNASAITFVPGKSAGWYLQRAGGASDLANRKEIFVIRANGLVVGRHSGAGKVLSTELDAGDVVVVPQKIIGASQFWRNLLTTAQIASSVAITAVVAGR
jgi:protein involved in polysaccharide export with SLBB domain